MLSEKFSALKTKKNINAEIGIAQTILKELGSFHQVLIAEIGAYEIGKIKQVCQMLQPKIGILTGINEQHLSTFGSQENIVKAKYELIESLPKDGTAIIKNKTDLSAKNVQINKEFISFNVQSKDGDSADFKVNLLGKHNIENILLAASCAKKLGMSLAEISKACLKIRPKQGAMKFLRKDAPTILDASYSTNPDGVIADLDYLKIYSGPEGKLSASYGVNKTLRQTQCKKIIVMPCLIELGKASKKVHERIGRKIAEVCDLAIITTKDYFQEIKEEAPNALLIENPKEIAAKLKGFDVVLLEGRVPKKVIELLNE